MEERKVKVLKEKQITTSEFENIPEKRNRVFRLNYYTMDGVIRTDKIFQKKKNVRNYLNRKNVIKVKLYMGDVIYE